MSVPAPLLQVDHLTKHFPQGGGLWGGKQSVVRAVEDVSFHINEGETLGLVGESGSGKSTTGRLLLRLIDATGGTFEYDGKAVFSLGKDELRALRREMQIVFQDPYGAFNPRMTIGRILGEGLELRGVTGRDAREAESVRLLHLVQMPGDIRNRYPHEFSGGQRQRIGIARALAVEPRFLVADEPVSALDVSTQAEIVNLLLDLQARLHLTMLFISHDLSVVRVLADRVAVMYAGRILETSTSESLFAHPLQPYTQELLEAIPVPDPTLARRGPRPVRDASAIDATGAGPSPEGCPYAPRCPHVMDVCRRDMPPMRDYALRLGETAPHLAACHWVEMTLPPPAQDRTTL